MDIWILLVQGCEGWETIDILFEMTAVKPKIKEIFAEHAYHKCVRIEHWYRDDANSHDANFCGVTDFFNDDDEVLLIFREDV